MKNGPLKGGGSCKCMPVFHPHKKKEVLYLVKKKNLGEIGKSSDQLSESELDS